MGKFSKKKINFFSFRRVIMITLIVIVILFSASISFAKLNKFELEFIKSKLNIPTIPELSQLGDEELIELLGEGIDPEKLPGLTYGVYSLLVFQEIDFIDWIVSQDYKTDFYKYFDSIVEDRTRLDSYLRGIGKDISIILEKTPSGPISALSLNTFSITTKVLEIGKVISRFAEQKLCDGLWVYFDYRRSGASHADAWKYAKEEYIKWIPNPETLEAIKRKSPLAYKYGAGGIDQRINQLESWFAQLWDKWGQCIEAGGVKKECKQKAREEVKTALLLELKTHQFVRKEAKPSSLEKVKLAGESLLKRVREVGNLVKNINQAVQTKIKEELAKISKKLQELAWFGGAQLIAPKEKPISEVGQEVGQEELEEKKKKEKEEEEVVVEEKEEEVEVEPRPIEPKPEKSREERLAEIQEILDDIAERVDVMTQEVAKITGTEIIEGEMALEKGKEEKEIEKEEKKKEEKEEEIEKKEKVSREVCFPNSIDINTALAEELEKINEVGPVLAQRIIEARPFSSFNDLLKVKGIGEKILQKIIAQGCAYVKGYAYVAAGGGGGAPPSPSPPEPTICSATTSPVFSPIIFNEIAWMGSASNSADEWIELKNVSTSTVSLSGWQLIGINTKDNKTKIKVFFENQDIVLVNGYFLLERSDDDSVPGIPADKIFTGAINDSEFVLRLFDSQCNLIDEVLATSSWPAGQNTSERKTMERDENLNWYTSFATSSLNGLFGTPKRENSKPPQNQIPIASFIYTPENPIVGQEILFDASSATDTDGTIVSYLWDFGDGNLTTTNQTTTTYSFATSGVFTISLVVIDDKGATSSPATTTISVSQAPTLQVVINEIAWMGTKASPDDEWIEFYNNTSSTIDIAGWRLVSSDQKLDIIFSTTTGAVTTTIPAQGFYLIERTDDNTVSDVLADWKGSFGNGLSNTNCEILSLYDQNNNLIDQTFCLPNNWPAGQSSPNYISMERISATTTGATSTNWASNNLITRSGKDAIGKNINGTPKTKNSVSISPTTISTLPFDEFDEITLTYLGNPYIIGDNPYGNLLLVPQGKILNIEPGVVLKFLASNVLGYGSSLRVDGTLKGVGGNAKPIIFTLYEESSGSHWLGIDFSSTSQNSILENFILEKARSWNQKEGHYGIKVEQGSITLKNSEIRDYSNRYQVLLINSNSEINNVSFLSPEFSQGEETAAIYIQGGSPTIKNSTFKKNSYGIKIENGASPSIERNNFEENEFPIYVVDSYPLFSGNQATNNNFNGILIKGTLSQNTVWQADLPYIVDYYLGVASSSSLTIEPGVVVKMKKGSIVSGYEAYLQILGSLIAEGTSNQPIVFTSLYDDSYGGDTNNDGTTTLPNLWDWREITFFPGSFGSLKEVIIRYGGYQTNNPLVIEVGANVSQENVTIEFSSKQP